MTVNLKDNEVELLAEVLESERARLMVEIRHSDHRAFREELKVRLAMVEQLAEHCKPELIRT